MNTPKQKGKIKRSRPLCAKAQRWVFCFLLLLCLTGSAALAVTSKVTRHSTADDFLKGQVCDIVVGSRGTLQLGRAAEPLIEEFADVWSINSVVASGGTIYMGTSPNGGIYKLSLGQLTKIYPLESEADTSAPEKSGQPGEQTDANDANTVEIEEYLSNEHIFAMTTDLSGRLLAGISGDRCTLMRLKNGQMETIFSPEDDKYIFAITVGENGDIYLGTGPQGKVYKLDSFGTNPELIYEARDKNILSLAVGPDDFVYAGSDGRGLVYKINPRTKTATVLYDSAQDEITALLFADDGDLYAAATSAKIVSAQKKFAAQTPLAGRPESKSEKSENVSELEEGLQLTIANTTKEKDGKPTKEPRPARKGPKPGRASLIYKITPDGFVTEVFSETAVLFCLTRQDSDLLVGTGNMGQLFSVDPSTEERRVVYEDQQASQITTVAVGPDGLYLGTANPAKIIKLGSGFSTQGNYASELIDAGQPAKWGKLQIEADIPAGSNVQIASRSGNVDDVNDPTFSQWTEPIDVTQPVQLRCPNGRFCQYKLLLQSGDGLKSPLIKKVAVAHSIPNLAPRVESVTISRSKAESKNGSFKISYKAKDENQDSLIYKIDFRKVGRKGWIKVKDKIEAKTFKWDGKTVEDGRYEVRVTASDERSNAAEKSLTGSRISDVVVVDNTAPAIEDYFCDKYNKKVTLKFRVSDELSAVGKVEYTINSNEDWVATVPDDAVYDTKNEDFTIVARKLEPGEHIIAIKVTDDVGNTAYKTFEIEMAGE